MIITLFRPIALFYGTDSIMWDILHNIVSPTIRKLMLLMWMYSTIQNKSINMNLRESLDLMHSFVFYIFQL